ncbi:hypothetical protein D9M68_972920 [compost metagenome]
MSLVHGHTALCAAQLHKNVRQLMGHNLIEERLEILPEDKPLKANLGDPMNLATDLHERYFRRRMLRHAVVKSHVHPYPLVRE